MAATFPSMHTFRDVVQHLLGFLGGVSADEHQYHASASVRGAYTEFGHRFRWADMKREGQLLTVASQTTGTIAYDHTGGAEERLCTLTGATVPDNAAFMFVRIGSVNYPIERQVSSTTFTLPYGHNPGADVASGTTYAIYRNGFVLPTDFRMMASPLLNNNGRRLEPVTSEQLLALMAADFQSGEPTMFCVQGDESTVGSRKIMLWPVPASAYRYCYHWSSSGRPLRVTGLSAACYQGTVAVSGTTVTGTGTAFSSSMIGSVIRVGTSTTEVPSNADDPQYPFTEERVILDVNSQTLTIDAAFDGSYSGVRYVVSDFIDIPDGPLYDAFLGLAEYRVSALRRDAKNQQSVLIEAERRIRLAREANGFVDEVFVSGEDYWPDGGGPRIPVRAEIEGIG